MLLICLYLSQLGCVKYTTHTQTRMMVKYSMHEHSLSTRLPYSKGEGESGIQSCRCALGCVQKATMATACLRIPKCQLRVIWRLWRGVLDEKLSISLPSHLATCEVLRCNYIAINQSDSCHWNSLGCKLLCMQLYQTPPPPLLWVWESGTETSMNITFYDYTSFIPIALTEALEG